MEPQTSKIVELVGLSDISYDAASWAMARAGRTLNGLGWYKVTDLRGLIRDGEVAEYQVTLQLGFRLMSAEELQARDRLPPH